MTTQNKADRAAEEYFGAAGFQVVPIQPLGAGSGKFKYGSPTIIGPCEPLETHRVFAEAVPWREGPMVLLHTESPRLALVQCFCCLGSGDIPVDLLGLRDYFDYGFENDLKDRFSSVNPLVGPGWVYFYKCADLKKQLSDSRLTLSYPFIGNTIACRSDDPQVLLKSSEEILRYFDETVPLPTIWGYPSDLPLGSTDNIFDVRTSSWYTARLQGEFKGTMSICGFVGTSVQEISMAQHSFQGSIEEVFVRRNTLTLHISDLSGNFQRKKKLGRLELAYQ